MTAPELPDDVSRWPDDPYRLLGVAQDVDPKELRRAYTRLIRTYKPEQYPEQFRRIREAYEEVLRRVEFYRFFQPVPTEEPPVSTPESPVALESPRVRSLTQEIHDAWQGACAGDEPAAYRRLLELRGLHPERDDVYAPLYWLLTLNPALDPARCPRDWLLEGLSISRLSGPLRELYRREIQDNDAYPLEESFHQLLSVPAAPTTVADFVEWRWLAAARQQQWQLLIEDVCELRTGVRHQDEQVWARLLISAVNYLSWGNNSALEYADTCRRELHGLVHLHRLLGDELDRLDYLHDVATSWQKLCFTQNVSLELLELLAASWYVPFAEVRPRLLNYLCSVDREPEKLVGELDCLRRDAPATLSLFGNLLVQLECSVESMPDDPRTPALLGQMTRAFLASQRDTKYAWLRLRLLKYCVREAVAPETVAAIATEGREDWMAALPDLAESITADWPLRYVCQAYRLFWA